MSLRTPTENPKESLLGVRHWSIVVKAATAVGLIVAVITLVLRADELKDRFFPPPPAPEVRLSDPRVTDERTSLGAYLAQYLGIDASRASSGEEIRRALFETGSSEDVVNALDDRGLSTQGLVVTTTADVKGLKGVCLPIYWSLEATDPSRKLPDEEWSLRQALPYRCLKPERNEERFSPQTWIPIPGQSGPFMVTITIFDATDESKRVPLAVSDPLEVLEPQ